MKRIYAVWIAVMAIGLLGIGINSYAAETVLTTRSYNLEDARVKFDAMGNALNSNETIIVTTRVTKTDSAGKVLSDITSTEKQTTTASWQNGTLKVDSQRVITDSVDNLNQGADGKPMAVGHTDITVNYTYTNGKLTGATGKLTPWTESYSFDSQTNKKTEINEITQTYKIENGQALLTKNTQVSSVYLGTGEFEGTSQSVSDYHYTWKGAQAIQDKVTTVANTWGKDVTKPADDLSYTKTISRQTQIATVDMNDSSAIAYIAGQWFVLKEKTVTTTESNRGTVNSVNKFLSNSKKTILSTTNVSEGGLVQERKSEAVAGKMISIGNSLAYDENNYAFDATAAPAKDVDNAWTVSGKYSELKYDAKFERHNSQGWYLGSLLDRFIQLADNVTATIN